MSKWIRKNLLIGEAHSLNHIANFPAPTLMYDGTKYLGGLRIAIKFESSKEACEFLEDKGRWEEWFKWMVLGEQMDTSYERLAWLKINGVPLKYWGEDSFSRIVSRFGKVTISFDNIHNKRDLSMGKFGVITSRKKWVNEEFQISVNGELHSVRVVEYTDDWLPFKPCLFEKMARKYDSEDSEGEDEDEGVSDTLMHKDDNEIEEGEFWLGATPEIQPEKMISHEGKVKSPGNLENVNEATVESTDVVPQDTKLVKEGNNDETTNINVAIGIPHDLKNDVLNGDTVSRSVTTMNNLGVDPILNDVGPSNNMVSLEHIGPIRSSTQNYTGDQKRLSQMKLGKRWL